MTKIADLAGALAFLLLVGTFGFVLIWALCVASYPFVINLLKVI